jgi:hypothetical protein
MLRFNRHLNLLGSARQNLHRKFTGIRLLVEAKP